MESSAPLDEVPPAPYQVGGDPAPPQVPRPAPVPPLRPSAVPEPVPEPASAPQPAPAFASASASARTLTAAGGSRPVRPHRPGSPSGLPARRPDLEGRRERTSIAVAAALTVGVLIGSGGWALLSHGSGTGEDGSASKGGPSGSAAPSGGAPSLAGAQQAPVPWPGAGSQSGDILRTPTRVRAMATGGATITVSWAEVPGAISYLIVPIGAGAARLEPRTVPPGDPTVIDGAAVQTTVYPGARSGVQYGFTITAIDDAGRRSAPSTPAVTPAR